MELVTDGLRRADEDNPKGYYELEAAKKTRQDAAWLDRAEGKAVKVIYRLLYDLPADREYRVIFMRRDMGEVVASQSIMLHRRDEQGAKLTAKQMAKAFARELAKLDNWLSRQDNFSLLDVDYRATVADPLLQAQRVNAFLGGNLDVAAMAAVVDPDLYRNRS